MSSSFNIEEVYQMNVQQGATSDKITSTMLHSEPSLSIYTTNQIQDGVFERPRTIGDESGSLGSGEFSFSKKMGLIEEDHVEEEMEDLEIGGEPNKHSLYLSGAGVGKDFDTNGDLGEYYMVILKEEPSNPLLLRNYAQFLQCQGDLSGAEEYYNRTTLADPKDGEILMQYAKLVWELHRDKDKASSYFERAITAAPSNSHIRAAYASFLWEMEESEGEEDDDGDSLANNRTMIGTRDSVAEDQERPLSSPLHLAAGVGLDAPGLGDGLNSVSSAETSSNDKGNIEDYYKRMIEVNPRDPLYLRNYAEFLYQSKGDLAEAEKYYSRATLSAPSDGEIISEYAKLVWQLHHDKEKATTYFEQAVQASPENSNVLGAYAKFLWEVEEDEE